MKTLTLIITLAATGVFAAPAIFESAAAQTRLVELYTSEGCSSCPPAEDQLNQLATHKGLWTDFVPIAFHVDYWNYLGWNDRFSAADFTARQRTYSKHWNARTIYTPCFVIDGKPKPLPTRWKPRGQSGVLGAVVNERDVAVTFTPPKEIKNLIAWVAPLSGKERSLVKAGENRGRKLEHCFVALDLQRARMTADGDSWTATLPLDRSENPRALAIWVSTADSPAPLQATGGWLAE